jgi:HD-like signal output (HDOD) protein
MSSISTVKPQVDRARLLQAATSLGLIGSGGTDSGARLLSRLCDPRVGGSEVALLIGNHPVLCARVLRVANSAYYGQQRSVTTIKQAVLLLGLAAIRGIAAAACVDRATPRRTQTDLADMPALLRHSLATAVAAESLARFEHESIASEAFIAGVLHNLGVAIQVSIDRSGVTAMLEERRRNPARDIRILESEFATVRHEDCVAAILDAWQLPEALVAATGYHHDPSRAPPAHRVLASLVSLGASLALASGHTFSLEPAAHAEPSLEAPSVLGLTTRELEQVTTELPEKVANLGRALFGS